MRGCGLCNTNKFRIRSHGGPKAKFATSLQQSGIDPSAACVTGISYNDASYIVELFEKWRQPTVQSLGSRINGIFSSQFHHSRFDKLLASLEVMSMAIELITKDGVGAFDEMNGVFEKITKYKGIGKGAA